MRNSKNLRDYTLEELEALFATRGLPGYRGRQVFKWLLKPVSDFAELTDLPKNLRQELAQEFSLFIPAIKKVETAQDGTQKLALELADGEVIECVLIPEEDHFTLCVSSQVGCAMGCAFCLTARMGFKRNLWPHEILGQVLRAKELLNQKGSLKPLRNIVFMGMGEPLANYENLIKTLKTLLHPKGFNFSKRRVTVSTAGLVPQIKRLGHDVTVRLAVSLHAARDEIRSRLMPINKRYPLTELLEACRSFPLPRGWRITFEYILLKGINDTVEDARRLADILRGIPAKINLIPFNEHPLLPFKCPEERVILAFQETLLARGFVATVRKSRGRDISAACGQLATKLAA